MTLLPNSCIFVLQINKTIPSTVNVPQRKHHTVGKINIFEDIIENKQVTYFDYFKQGKYNFVIL